MQLNTNVSKAMLAAYAVLSLSGVSSQTEGDAITINLPIPPSLAKAKIIETKDIPTGSSVQFLTYELNNKELSEQKLVKLISGIFGRNVSYSIDYDDDMDLYFFRITSSDELLDSDFDKLEISDNNLRNRLFKNKRVIVTLEDENV